MKMRLLVVKDDARTIFLKRIIGKVLDHNMLWSQDFPV